MTAISPFKLERYFARWEFCAPYLLCTSDIEGVAMREILTLADAETSDLWERLTLGYTESSGHPLLRAEIARLYEHATPDDILVFAGAEEAIYVAEQVLLGPGDHLIAAFPGYQSSYEVARAAGAEVTRWSMHPVRQDGQTTWKLDLDELRQAMRPNTRMALVNFPHNPTGAMVSQAEWLELVGIVSDAGCYLFSDEVYRELEYESVNRLPAAVDLYEKGISLGVMSKPYGLAGLRIGWIACRDANLLARLAGYKDYTTICNSAPSEILAIIALRAREKLLKRSLYLIQSNLALVESMMEKLPGFFEWIPPQAGSICFPRWSGPGNVEQFCDDLVRSQGVLLLPGAVYDYPGNHFRLGLGRKNIPEALERLRLFLGSMRSAVV